MANCAHCSSENVQITAIKKSDLEALDIPVAIEGINKVKCADCDSDDILVPDLSGLIAAAALSLASMPYKLNANEIKFCRKALGYSSKRLAEELDIAPETVSRWENEKQPIGAAQERILRMKLVSELGPKAQDIPMSLEEILSLKISPIRPNSLRPKIIYGAKDSQGSFGFSDDASNGRYKVG